MLNVSEEALIGTAFPTHYPVAAARYQANPQLGAGERNCPHKGIGVVALSAVAALAVQIVDRTLRNL